MGHILGFLLLLNIVRNTNAIVGYKFSDNLVKERMISENGEISLILPNTPEKVSICLSLFIDFNRYSDILPIFDFRNEYSESPFINFYGRMSTRFFYIIRRLFRKT